jgi:hypothetical protein
MSTAILPPMTLTVAELVADLPTRALSVVHLAEPLAFGRSAAHDLELLRLLRLATSHAVRLRWTISGRPLFPSHTYTHLLPPWSGLSLDDLGYAVEWARDYRYGTFYYRRGPGLVTVKDVRPGVAASRMVVEDGAETFLRLAESPDGGFTPTEESLVDDAVAAGLALREADRVLILPFRMRHWPVPYQAI